MNLISLFTMSILTQNIVLHRFLGICPFIGTSKSGKNAFSMGLSVTTVVTLASLITYFIYYYVLVPTNTTYLKTVAFILVIASLVQCLEILLKKYNKPLYETLGIYLPLITTNCAVLGVTLLTIGNEYNLIETLIFSIGSGVGFTLVSYVFGTIRERLEYADVPNCFKGYPIALITAAMMALLFTRYILL